MYLFSRYHGPQDWVKCSHGISWPWTQPSIVFSCATPHQPSNVSLLVTTHFFALACELRVRTMTLTVEKCVCLQSAHSMAMETCLRGSGVRHPNANPSSQIPCTMSPHASHSDLSNPQFPSSGRGK